MPVRPRPGCLDAPRLLAAASDAELRRMDVAAARVELERRGLLGQALGGNTKGSAS